MQLLRVLLVYLGASFAVLEAIDLLSGKVGLPDWVFVGALILLLLGLPIVAATTLIQARAPWSAKPAAADTPTSDPTVAGLRGLLTWRKALLAGVSAFALWGVIVTGWLVLRSAPDDDTAGVDPNLVAVLPFRVAGADASLAYLSEGMVDLMAALLTGEGGLRALDPRTTLAAVRDGREIDEAEAAEIVRALGAGQVMLGSVVGSRDALVLAVSMVSADGTRTVRTQVQGPADSLQLLLDQLTGELLTRQAGVGNERTSALSSSLEAIRAYVDGQSAYRSGRFETSARHFARATEIDSSFVLATFGAVSALIWIEDTKSPRFVNAALAAWDGLERLPVRDRPLMTVVMADANLIPMSRAALVEQLEDAVTRFPDHAEAWYWLGDDYFHWGARLVVDAPFERAEADLKRAYSLDSTFAVPLIHLVELAAFRRDPSSRRLLGRYLAYDSTSYISAQLSLLVGAANDDPTLIDDAFRIAAEADDIAFSWTAGLALQFGIAVDQVDRILDASQTFARTDVEQTLLAQQVGAVAAVRGRPRQAAEVLSRAGEDSDLLLILNALYSDLDDELVHDAVEREMRRAAAAPAETVAGRRRQGRAACAIGQWKLRHGAATVKAEIERLQAGAQTHDERGYPEADPTCLKLLEAMSAVTAGRPDARRLVADLDSLLQTGPAGQREEYNLAVSILLERANLPARGLAAARRRSYDWDAPFYVANYLLQEGRLAERTGDREGAIAAYSHYLKLREEPAPQLVAQRDSVQAALARLTGER